MKKFPRIHMSASKITPDVANSAAKFDRIRRAHQSEVAEDLSLIHI